MSAKILKSKLATQWVIIIITWVAFLLRVNQLGSQSLWRDETDAIFFSSWKLNDLLLGLTWTGHNGPLFFMLLNPWRMFTGNSEFALRYPSALLGALAIPLSFIVARQIGFSRRTGVITGLLLATSPYLIWYGQEAKMYAMLVVVVTLAFIAYLKALAGEGNRWWVVFVVATSISFYLHILTPLMLLVYVIVALLMFKQFRQRWLAWLISFACLTLPYLPLVIWQLSFFIEGADRGHPFYPLQRQFHILLQLYSSGLLQLIGTTAIILFVFLFLCGLFLTNARAKAEHLTITRRLILATWALIPPLTVYLVSLRVPVFEDRYIIYITPAFYLVVALGIVLLRQYSKQLAALCLGLILVFNLMGIWQQQRHPIKADFRATAEYLYSQTHSPSTIMIQMPYLKRTFNYYYKDEYNYLEGLWTNAGKTDAALNAEMLQLTAELTDLWLVLSEADTWDNRKMVKTWLDENAHLVDQAHFNRVDIYYYQFRPGTINAPSLLFDEN